jgi:hypothetical protein
LRANGHPSDGPWRQCHCTAGDGYFLATQGTIFHGKQAAVELIVRVGDGVEHAAEVREIVDAPEIGGRCSKRELRP